MRIFTAVTFGESTRQYLQESAKAISSLYKDAKLVRAENMHMTIVFIGEADRAKVNKVIRATKKTSKEIKGFEAAIDGISSFRKKNSHTVYCNIENSDELLTLHSIMISNLKACGVETDSMKYKPHITLARQARLTGENNEIRFPRKIIEVNEICVMESSRINGILTYTPLEKFNLGVK
ncbi:MAG: RNA 2',3'-cyclic phosphodiesterase [Clostridia bacterium]|nr:RNA 2',3'-cyclic phosphodiesterase [Clostridia bacterium]